MVPPAAPPAPQPSPQSAPAVRVRLLGGFGVTIGGTPVPEAAWRVQKAKGLVKLLALAPGHRLARDQLLDLLWPDFEPEAAANNLYRTLAAARHALGPAVPLRLRGGVLALDPAGPLEVDVEAFEAAAARARRSSDLADHEAALALYGGELLPEDRYEDWAAARREALKEAHRGLLLAAAERHRAGGGHAAAVAALQRLVDGDPTHEPAHVALMRLYAASGQRARAARQYQELQDALARELDAEPEPATRRLHAAILTGRYPAPAGAPPTEPAPPPPSEPAAPPPSSPTPALPAPPAPPAPRHNLPVQLTSFVGRAREVAELRDLLAPVAGRPRLVTLTGIGGGGKTRLALAVAAALVPEYPDGVWLVELAPLADPALVARAVADALGVREQPGRPLPDTLAAALRPRRLLLVLDNCEHVVDGAAHLAQALLSACPGLRVLATSREALRLSGEIAWRVPPLDLPADPAAPGQRPSPEEAAGSAAVGLFVERARRRQPGFALTAANAGAVVAACRRLDGLPLAIELAAARIGMLTPEQLARRLDDALRLLTGGSRTAPTRQQTLRATLDWSYRLLVEGEQRLFRRLAVFAGGWTLAAAEAITPAPEGMADPASGEVLDVLDLLEQLADKSLVQAEPTDDVARYRLLEPVRQYALEKLAASGEEAEARRRHGAYYTALAEEQEPVPWRVDHAAAVTRLDPEHDNLRAALRWALDAGMAERALRLAGALWRYWSMRGLVQEGRRWLAAALAAGRDEAPALRTKALNGAASLAHSAGDLAAAVALFEERLALLRATDDRWQTAGCLSNLGRALAERGDFARAEALLQESLVLYRAQDFRWGEGLALRNLGHLLVYRGAYQEAAALLEQAAAAFRELDNHWGLSQALLLLGEAALELGDPDRARAHLVESLALGRDEGDRLTIVDILEGLARVAGAHDGAPGAVRAARLYGAAEALREVLGAPLLPLQRARHERHVSAVREQLDPSAFDAARVAGRTLSLEDAIAEALADRAP